MTNSAVVFAAPASPTGFESLTVDNCVGSNADLTMYASPDGPSLLSDQIIIDGGSATGTTDITLMNGGSFVGATAGGSVPLIEAIDGGSIAPNAFELVGTPVFDGYKYSLEYVNGAFYLVSTPSAVPEPSTWAMLLAGFGGLGFAGLRRARTAPRLCHRATW